MKKSLMLVFSVLAAFAVQAISVGDELFPNGKMKELDKNGWPVGWGKNDTAKIVQEAGIPTLTIRNGGVNFRIPIAPEYSKLRLRMRMKVIDVTQGIESWRTGRMTMKFIDAKGMQAGQWPNVFGFTGTSNWIDCDREYIVPRNAKFLEISPSNLGTTGETCFQNISLSVSRLRAMKPTDLALPPGSDPDPFSLSDAWRQTTPTRERICLNGLWRFRPVPTNETVNAVPPKEGDGWGWFKVPGIWSNFIGDNGSENQQVWLSPWLEENDSLLGADQAWYKRTFALPPRWTGRRICLEFTMLQTQASFFVDGKKAGELWYPGGTFELTDAFPSDGKPHELSILVTARPLSAENEVFMAPDRILKNKARVDLRGITGDLFLSSMPKTERLEDAQIICSVSRGDITFAAETSGLDAKRKYRVRADVSGCGEQKTFLSTPLQIQTNGILRFTAAWRNARLWDIDTPQNRYTVSLTLLDGNGSTRDTLTPIEFGFREFRIQGRDFLLNEKPIHLRLLHNSTANSTAGFASESAAREVIRRMRKYGFNALISGNYSCKPGSTGYIDGLLNASDATGMLNTFTLPHFRDYDNKLTNPAIAERYRKHAEFLIRRVRNHPSVIAYAMNHNGTGYHGDQNPLKIDGSYEYAPTNCPWYFRSRKQALITAGIAKALDSTRPVYHHESGNLSDMHTVNCYLNWAPRQERSDWLTHWAAEGVKPLFFVEWGTPHISSWSSYRGPEFIWRCKAFQSLWAAEFSAQVWGDAAYVDSQEAVDALDHEEKLWAKGKPFNWSSLNVPLRRNQLAYQQVQGFFINDYLRSHRTYGISAMLPWDQGDLWERITPCGHAEEVQDSLRRIKRPGIVPDRITQGREYVHDTGAEECFQPSGGGVAMLRWNMPECAYIGGPERDFTEKDHLYAPGAAVRKSLVLLNDTCRDRDVHWHWSLWTHGAEKPRQVSKGMRGVTRVSAGGKWFVPVTFTLPDDACTSSEYVLRASFTYDNGVEQKDTFALRVIAQDEKRQEKTTIHLYDPHGLTAELLHRLSIPYTLFGGAEDVPTNGLIVIGREAVGTNGLPWFSRLPADRRVVFFEQRAGILENVFGFRVAERGTRIFFPRGDHPITRGLDAECFRDWSGMATLLTPYLDDLPLYETKYPHQSWCGFTNTRVWRCGTRGSVASALIEKPAKGNWRALLDGAFDLQYTPLLECKDGDSLLFFCQLDVTGRTSPDPVADLMVKRILCHAAQAEKNKSCNTCCIGDDRAATLLRDLGISSHADLERGNLLVAASGARPPHDLAARVAAGLSVLCLGMSGEECAAWSPVPLPTVHTNACFTRLNPDVDPVLNGLCNADWAWHGRMEFDAFLPQSGVFAKGAWAIVRKGKGVLVFWQVPPWKIDDVKKPYLRTSKRHANALAARLLGNLGAVSATPLTGLLSSPQDNAWLKSYYLDIPVASDDPYRYYRW